MMLLSFFSLMKERIKKRVTCPLAFLLLTFLFFCNDDDVNDDENRTTEKEETRLPVKIIVDALLSLTLSLLTTMYESSYKEKK